MIQTRENITAREHEEHQWDVEARDAHFAHEKEMKRLDIEVLKTEAKITSWFKIPITIITLPVRFLFGLGFIVAMIRKHEPSESFWRWLK